jgi:hypothetical protein
LLEKIIASLDFFYEGSLFCVLLQGEFQLTLGATPLLLVVAALSKASRAFLSKCLAFLLYMPQG